MQCRMAKTVNAVFGAQIWTVQLLTTSTGREASGLHTPLQTPASGAAPSPAESTEGRAQGRAPPRAPRAAESGPGFAHILCVRGRGHRGSPQAEGRTRGHSLGGEDAAPQTRTQGRPRRPDLRSPHRLKPRPRPLDPRAPAAARAHSRPHPRPAAASAVRPEPGPTAPAHWRPPAPP